MNLRKLILHIIENAESRKKEYRFDILEEKIRNIENICFLLEKEFMLIQFIPDFYPPSSSLEKEWAKSSDILLAEYFNCLGYVSEALKSRGDSADVLAMKNNRQILVADAKCFRITRTARNQKDFKVNSLSSWRKKSSYAILVAPLTLYPIQESQIYSQAISSNVLLISYSQLQFLLSNKNNFSLDDLEKNLFNVKNLFSGQTQTKKMSEYFKNVNKAILSLTSATSNEYFEFIREKENSALFITKEETLSWLEKLKERINKMDINQLRQELDRFYRISEKIEILSNTLKYANNLINVLKNSI